MKRSLYISILFLFISLSGKAQTRVDLNNMVGFGCYDSGQPSKAVEKISRLLSKSNYQAIINLLNSNKGAEQFLAVVVAEKLSDTKRFHLTQAHKTKIDEICASKEMVSVCSGCMYFEKVPLKDLLNRQNLHQTKESANYWIAGKLSFN